MKGYYRVEPIEPNIFRDASLSELVAQLERCDYRCEAGPLRMNLAFMELKRRAEIEDAVGREVVPDNEHITAIAAVDLAPYDRVRYGDDWMIWLCAYDEYAIGRASRAIKAGETVTLGVDDLADIRMGDKDYLHLVRMTGRSEKVEIREG